ncbi:MAG TPA: glycosyltransferase family 39 protein [Casimicrobiaceae bacterium]
MPLAEAQSTSLDDAAGLSPSGPYRALKQAGLVVLCATWVLLGLFGHDPWKPDDATSIGVAHEMLQRHDYVVAHIAGTALPERAPLYYALAAASAAMLSPLLSLHDGARVANAVCLSLTLWLLALCGRELYGRAFRWLPVLLFIGCVGLWDRAHYMAPEVGLLAAYALALYSLALSPRRYAVSGALLGLSAGLAFLCRGSLGLALIAATALLVSMFRPWRTRHQVVTLALALALAAPLIAVWPWALYARDPALYAQWLHAQDIHRFFGQTVNAPPVDLYWYAKNLPWFAFPVLPLALWTLWVRRRGDNGGLGSAGVTLPATAAVVITVILSVTAAEPRALLALSVLVPLSLLASAEIDTLKRGASGLLDWFGILTFGLLAVLVWALWGESWRNGLPEAVARLFNDTQPGYQPPVQWLALAIGVFLSLLWVVLVRPARRSNRRAVLNWAAGMTLVWGLYMTIWLPYLDSRRSYRPVVESLAPELPAGGCVASHNLGEPQRALFEYFIGLVTVRDEIEPGHACQSLLMQVGRDDSDTPPDSAWVPVWEGRRRGDSTERYLLFRRTDARPAA